MANRMQVDRRKDTIPWTWEPLVAALLIYVFAALATAQVARGTAYLLAGDGWRWPAATAQVSSAFSIFAGNSNAGLVTASAPALNPMLLYICLVLFEALTFVGLTATAVLMIQRFGPGRMLGMATRSDAQQLLGSLRLRRHATVIRPDLYRPLDDRQQSRPISRQSDAMVLAPKPSLAERGSGALINLFTGR